MDQTKSMFRSLLGNRKLLFIAAAVVVAILVAVLVLTVSGHDDTRDGMQRLSLRYAALVKLTNDSKKNIVSSDLTKINSEANLQLSSDSSSISKLLTDRYGSKIPDNITASETDTTSAGKLEEAALLAKFDGAYKQVLTQKLNAINALLIELIQKSNNSKNKSVFVDLQNHSNNLIGRLEKLQV